MLIIGLTGGIGTGKSFVASIFRKLGAEVVEADKLGHKAFEKGTSTHKKVVAEFGKRILSPRGLIDRKILAGIVFSDKKKLEKLNRIVHPVIISGICDRIRSAGKSGILVVDAPLICEAGITGLMDVLVVVKASKKNQIDRCYKKSGMSRKDVCKRTACQMPLSAKIRMSDYTVDNNGMKEDTKKQVRKIWQELKKGA